MCAILLDLFSLKNRKKKILWTLFSSVLCVVIVGLNETSMHILVVIMFSLFAAKYYVKKTPDPILSILFLSQQLLRQ